MSDQDGSNSTMPELNPDSKSCPHCGHINPSWRSTCESCDQGMSSDAKPARRGRAVKPDVSVNGMCQSCNTRIGTPYSFHYLKRIGTGKTALYSDYHDVGIGTSVLCDKCVSKHRNKELLQFVFFVIFFFTGSFFSLSLFGRIMAQTNNFSAIFLASGLTTFLLGIGSIWVLVNNAKGGKNYSGTSFAIKIWKKWLNEQGYGSVLYEDEYQKLKSKV